MNQIRFKISLWVALWMLVHACSPASVPENVQPDGTIIIEIRVFAEAGMDTASVRDTLFMDILQCTGQVDVLPAARRLISSPIAGILSACDVIEGERVRQGSLLFTIEGLEIAELQYNFVESKVNLGLMTNQLERTRRLAQGDATSQRELQQAEASYASAKAKYETLEQKLNLVNLQPERHGIVPKLSFRAPFNGIVAKRMVTNGQFIQAEMPLLELIDDSRKTIHLELLGNQRMRAEPGQQVILPNPLENTEGIVAELIRISPVVDPSTSAVSATATIKSGNAEKLPVGAFVQAGIVTGTRSVKYLPATAIIPHEGKQFVLLVESIDDKRMVLRPVEVLTGQISGSMVELLSAQTIMGKQVLSVGGYQLLQ